MIEFNSKMIVFIGSISLKGAAIDDLTFKEYNIELNGSDKNNLIEPKKILMMVYLIESGFVSTNKNIDIPDASTVWKVSGNKRLN